MKSLPSPRIKGLTHRFWKCMLIALIAASSMLLSASAWKPAETSVKTKSPYQAILDRYRKQISDSSWEDNVLMEDVFYDMKRLRNRTGGRVLGSDLYRDQIKTITFLDTLEDAPGDSWCVSEAEDGSVLAWTEKNGRLYDLYIAGEGGVCAPENACGLFAGYDHVEEINFDGNFHTDYTTQMQYMFYACYALEDLDVSDFVTTDVTQMQCMFAWCKALTSLDLTSFDTCSVRDMGSMFMHCESLVFLDLTSFTVTSKTNTAYMFNNCPSDACILRNW